MQMISNLFNEAERKYLLFITILYFVFFVFRILSGNFYLSDSYDYLEIAKYINNFEYFDYKNQPELFTRRPIIYPLFLASLIEFKPWVLILFQTMFGILNTILFLKILKQLKIEIKLNYIFLFLFTPSIFIYHQLFMSEWMVMLGLNFLFILILKPFSNKNFIYIQLITILLAFTKPIFYPFIYINFVFFIFYFIKKKVFNFAIFIPILALTVFLNYNENKTGFKHFTSIENHILINYNIYYYKVSELGKQPADAWLKMVYDNEKYENKTFKEQNVYLKKVAFTEIQNNFVGYGFYHLKTAIRGVLDPGRFDLMTFFKKEDGKQGFLEILNGSKSISILFKNQYVWIYVLLIPIFIINLIKLFFAGKFLVKNKQNWLFYYIVILFIYYVLVSGPVNCSRYLMPFQMILMALALAGWQQKSLNKFTKP